jgi:hypothetical protein
LAACSGSTCTCSLSCSLSRKFIFCAIWKSAANFLMEGLSSKAGNYFAVQEMSCF